MGLGISSVRGKGPVVKRRGVLAGVIVALLVGGCGGGSSGNGARPAASSGSSGAGKIVSAQASDGRLVGALVARPGSTRTSGHEERVTGRSVRPRSNGHGVGAEANCADAAVQPTADNLAHVSDVVFCLMNAMRANAGVAPLQQQDQLAQASVGHSQDMVTNKYFAHDSQDGRDVVARLKQVGYIPTSGSWVIGENLVWGAGALATPTALVNAWMNSPPHRENLLSPDFREVGMGLTYGTPSADAPDGVTVTTDFGTRPGMASSTQAPAADTTPSGSGTTQTSPSSTTQATLAAAHRRVVARRAAARRRVAAKRRRALRRCSHRHGSAKRRCVRAARRIRH
jgi:uncharacterized protein YkwD